MAVLNELVLAERGRCSLAQLLPYADISSVLPDVLNFQVKLEIIFNVKISNFKALTWANETCLSAEFDLQTPCLRKQFGSDLIRQGMTTE